MEFHDYRCRLLGSFTVHGLQMLTKLINFGVRADPINLAINGTLAQKQIPTPAPTQPTILHNIVIYIARNIIL